MTEGRRTGRRAEDEADAAVLLPFLGRRADEFDPDGVVFPTLGEARANAVRALAEMAKDTLDGDTGARTLTVSVVDGSGRTVLVARLTFETTCESER